MEKEIIINEYYTLSQIEDYHKSLTELSYETIESLINKIKEQAEELEKLKEFKEAKELWENSAVQEEQIKQYLQEFIDEQYENTF